MTVQDQIQRRIQQFATELEALVRQSAIEAVSSSLGGSNGAPIAPAHRTAVSTGRPRARAKAGGKRDPRVIEALVASVAAHVKAHPGHGVEAIASALKTSTHDITLPITKLLATKAIKKKGVKRATKYYPA